MGTSRNGGPQKTNGRKTAGKTSAANAQDAPQAPKKKTRGRQAPQDELLPPPGRRILTQEEFQARVAEKAFELYLKRHAVTEVDDWLEAEQLVRLQLLTEEQEARSV